MVNVYAYLVFAGASSHLGQGSVTVKSYKKYRMRLLSTHHVLYDTDVQYYQYIICTIMLFLHCHMSCDYNA